MQRRNFLHNTAGAGLALGLPQWLTATALAEAAQPRIWGSLLHLSFNMWEDHDKLKGSENTNLRVRIWHNELNISETLWRDSLKKMADSGLNMVVIDLGNAVKYDSHPEIAVTNAWSPARLKQELDTMRKLGLEPIPKLNFSAGHDAWLKEYSRMVSTDTYYKVCGELIAETIALFNKPRFFHLGYDEEKALNQRFQSMAVIRQGDLWWKDFLFFVAEVERGGVRPWIWSDFAWENAEEFYQKMPKSVLQSNWYYGSEFTDLEHKVLKTFIRLNKEGFDQIPCGAYYVAQTEKPKDANLPGLVKFAKDHVDDKKLLGFLHTSWRPTTDDFGQEIFRGLDLTAEGKRWFDEQKK